MAGLLLCCLLATGAGAEVYQWRDADGRLHFTNRKPPQQAQKVDVSDSNSYADSSDELPSTPRIQMYATSWCGYCKKARAYFRNNNIAFTEYDIEKDAQAARRYKAFGGKGVPVIFINKRRLSGFNAQRFDLLYKAASKP